VKTLVALLLAATAGPSPHDRIYVARESGDIVSQLEWDGTALRTVKVVPVGITPSDIDGPHYVTMPVLP
jgi:hypothetical protein